MTAADQYHRWGACVDSSDDVVLLQVGDKIARLTPADARKFCFELAGAYYRAEKTEAVTR